ncbi:MAG: preprotein translocase subunit SecE [SAR202 cluster bacterium]|nr:preprotein translocase subunit SecE [SAR202 cluster bacterium]
MLQQTGTPSTRGFSVVRLFNEVTGELRRVTWPTREETFRLTMMVIAVSAVMGVFLGGVDLAFNRLMDWFVGL